jgi:hypothetical protein
LPLSPVAVNAPAVQTTTTIRETVTPAKNPETQTAIAVATYRQSVAETLVWRNTHEPVFTPERPVGIIEMGDPTFYNEGYDIQNSWQRQIDNYWAQAYAGSLLDNPEQGVVIVTWDLPNAPSGGVYLTHVRAGSVRIVAEQNYRLTLEAKDGTVFYFDVPGQKFATSLTETVPTVTPRPTYTPIPSATSARTGYP